MDEFPTNKPQCGRAYQRPRKKISYGFGDVACNVVFALTMSLSTYFYTDVVGMSAALVGTILLLSRIF